MVDTMIKLDISGSSFMDVPIVEADSWMNDNVGEVISDDTKCTVGFGWRVYMIDDGAAHDFGRWYIEFEEEKHATLFLLRWS